MTDPTRQDADTPTALTGAAEQPALDAGDTDPDALAGDEAEPAIDLGYLTASEDIDGGDTDDSTDQ